MDADREPEEYVASFEYPELPPAVNRLAESVRARVPPAEIGLGVDDRCSSRNGNDAGDEGLRIGDGGIAAGTASFCC